MLLRRKKAELQSESSQSIAKATVSPMPVRHPAWMSALGDAPRIRTPAHNKPTSGRYLADAGRSSGAAGSGVTLTTEPLPTPCDESHINNLILPAYDEARRWRRATLRWFDTHLEYIQRRGRLIRGDGYIHVGQVILNYLRLLDEHFNISREIRRRRAYFPQSANETVNVRDLEAFGNATYWIRRRYRDINLSGLTFYCDTTSSPRSHGHLVRGRSVPGSLEITFYTNAFDHQTAKERAGIAMHEAFHATFVEFDSDSYSSRGSYPGATPLTNADSYATFAAIVTTGSTHREGITQLDADTEISGSQDGPE